MNDGAKRWSYGIAGNPVFGVVKLRGGHLRLDHGSDLRIVVIRARQRIQ